jgi:hypothetical protein
MVHGALAWMRRSRGLNCQLERVRLIVSVSATDGMSPTNGRSDTLQRNTSGDRLLRGRKEGREGKITGLFGPAVLMGLAVDNPIMSCTLLTRPAFRQQVERPDRPLTSEAPRTTRQCIEYELGSG